MVGLYIFSTALTLMVLGRYSTTVEYGVNAKIALSGSNPCISTFDLPRKRCLLRRALD